MPGPAESSPMIGLRRRKPKLPAETISGDRWVRAVSMLLSGQGLASTRSGAGSAPSGSRLTRPTKCKPPLTRRPAPPGQRLVSQLTEATRTSPFQPGLGLRPPPHLLDFAPDRLRHGPQPGGPVVAGG